MKKTKVFVLVLLLGLFFLGGCFELEGELIFSSDGSATAAIKVQADEYSGGNEAKILAWQIDFLFPDVNLNYNRKVSSIEEGWYYYTVISWERDEHLDVTDSEYFSFKEKADGTYEFFATIPQILEEISSDEKNDIVLVFSVTMPNKIDMANTTQVEGNSARWVISKEMLTRDTTLRAFTY